MHLQQHDPDTLCEVFKGMVGGPLSASVGVDNVTEVLDTLCRVMKHVWRWLDCSQRSEVGSELVDWRLRFHGVQAWSGGVGGLGEMVRICRGIVRGLEVGLGEE